MVEQTEQKVKNILNELTYETTDTTRKSMQDVVNILLQKNMNSSNKNEGTYLMSSNSDNNFDMSELIWGKNNNNTVYELKTNWEIRSHRKRIGKLIVFGKKFVRKFLRWYIEPIAEQQNAINSSFTASINALCNNEIVTQDQFKIMRTEQQEIKAFMEQQEKRFKQQMLDIKENLVMQFEESKKEYEKQVSLYIEKQNQRLKILEEKDNLSQLESSLKELRNNLETQKEKFIAMSDAGSTELDYLHFKLTQLGNMKNFDSDLFEKPEIKLEEKTFKKPIPNEKIDYFKFENHFRGNRKNIKNSQKMYLPYFQGKNNVLDLGCGRGEFLELLQENDVNARGVDIYPDFVEYCQYKGLNTIEADAIPYINQLENESVDGIFSAQLVEHLTADQIISLCNIAYQKLKKGCYFVIETPNPSSLSIYMNSFYLDPSHVKPIHPKAMEYFLKEAGFKETDVIYTEQSKVDYKLPLLRGNQIENLAEFNDGINFLSDIIWGSQDYAIIAKK